MSGKELCQDQEFYDNLSIKKLRRMYKKFKTIYSLKPLALGFSKKKLAKTLCAFSSLIQEVPFYVAQQKCLNTQTFSNCKSHTQVTTYIENNKDKEYINIKKTKEPIIETNKTYALTSVHSPILMDVPPNTKNIANPPEKVVYLRENKSGNLEEVDSVISSTSYTPYSKFTNIVSHKRAKELASKAKLSSHRAQKIQNDAISKKYKYK